MHREDEEEGEPGRGGSRCVRRGGRMVAVGRSARLLRDERNIGEYSLARGGGPPPSWGTTILAQSMGKLGCTGTAKFTAARSVLLLDRLRRDRSRFPFSTLLSSLSHLCSKPSPHYAPTPPGFSPSSDPSFAFPLLFSCPTSPFLLYTYTNIYKDTYIFPDRKSLALGDTRKVSADSRATLKTTADGRYPVRH